MILPLKIILHLRHLFLKILLLVAVAIKDVVSCNKFTIEVHLVTAAAGSKREDKTAWTTY